MKRGEMQKKFFQFLDRLPHFPFYRTIRLNVKVKKNGDKHKVRKGTKRAKGKMKENCFFGKERLATLCLLFYLRSRCKEYKV